ncbi:MAG: DUF4037 domain-containing protein [Caldilineaceae bacterium]|nr:DUF4037 domain-containing protein [Caldilineaceae bacterium]
MTPPFIPGLQLNQQFYTEIVRTLLDREFPNLAHSAALMGYGSDVLGYDTAMSTDHNWGPRFQLFLSPPDHDRYRAAVDQALRQHLPSTFLGYPVNFSEPDLADGGVQRMEDGQTIVHHLIEITTIPAFFQRYLARDPYAPLNGVDWLVLGEQKLLEVTAGQVYYDGLAELLELRAKFAYYPHDLWLYRIAAQWKRIAQEEAFMGRCGDVGDELGSHLVAARLARDLMRLAFLLERRYAPYSKWFGTAFARLACGPTLTPLLNRLLDTNPWPARQEPLCEAYVLLAEMHNALGITARVAPTITDYFNRPYKVIFADRFVDATRQAIRDEFLQQLASDIGGVDQLVDCTDVTAQPQLMQKLQVLYRSAIT